MSEVREEYEEAHRIAKELRAMMATPGWKILQDVASAQVQARQIANGQPMFKVDDVLARQLVSGEVLGITLVMATPESMVEEAETTIKQLKDKIPNE